MGLKEQYEIEEAAANRAYALISLAPHMMWPVRIYREGQEWACTLDHHMQREKCPTAFGKSPHEACENFDLMWNQGLPDEEDEEEEF